MAAYRDDGKLRRPSNVPEGIRAMSSAGEIRVMIADELGITESYRFVEDGEGKVPSPKVS